MTRAQRFLRRTSRPRTRIFFATDLHASNRSFRKFLNAAAAYEADALVMGGDVCGKVVVPIVDGGDGAYRLSLSGQDRTVEGDAALAGVCDVIETQGHYPYVVSPSGYARLRDDPDAVDGLYVRLARERLAQWRELAEERLRERGVRCYATGGNDDRPEALEALAGSDGEGALEFCEGRFAVIGDRYVMASCGYSNPTPWHTPREVGEDRLSELIDSAISEIGDFDSAIFNFHVPPHDSTLDLCPLLDGSTDPPSPVVEGGSPVVAPAGSTAVRDAIERHQPLLGLHGHIHESRGVAELGRTLCINPGSEYGEGILRGCIVNLVDGQVGSYQLTSG